MSNNKQPQARGGKIGNYNHEQFEHFAKSTPPAREEGAPVADELWRYKLPHGEGEQIVIAECPPGPFDTVAYDVTRFVPENAPPSPSPDALSAAREAYLGPYTEVAMGLHSAIVGALRLDNHDTTRSIELAGKVVRNLSYCSVLEPAQKLATARAALVKIAATQLEPEPAIELMWTMARIANEALAALDAAIKEAGRG